MDANAGAGGSRWVRGTRFALRGRGEVVFLSLEYASCVSGPLLGNMSVFLTNSGWVFFLNKVCVFLSGPYPSCCLTEGWV